MPPHLPGNGYSLPPGPNRREADIADKPAGESGQHFGRRTAGTAPPPLPRQPNVHRQHPWPLQSQANANSQLLQVESSDSVPAGEEVATVQPPPVARSGFSAVGYTAIGFLAGALFWHAVGFWTLVHDAVFSGPRLESRTQQTVPVVAAPPVATFDERTLRNHVTRSTASQAWEDTQKIATGSISASAPSPKTSAKPQVSPPPRPAGASNVDPRFVTGPETTTWQPAVSRTPTTDSN